MQLTSSKLLKSFVPCAGEEAAKVHGAPPIPLMRYVSTSGTMDDIVSKLLVLLSTELTRFGNNAQPVRVFTDCSTVETGAFCLVYNKMNAEAYCNLRVRQVFTGQPNKNPVDSEALMEHNWCNPHVQHAKGTWPIQHGKGKVLNAARGLQSRFMVATGQLLTVVPTFPCLVQWMKVSCPEVLVLLAANPSFSKQIFRRSLKTALLLVQVLLLSRPTRSEFSPCWDLGSGLSAVVS